MKKIEKYDSQQRNEETHDPDIILEVKALTKQYGSGDSSTLALKDATFQVYKGEFVLIVGHSGSGKSTLLNMIGLLDKPTSGEVYIKGLVTSSLSDSQRADLRKHNIGFVFQFFNLISDLTVVENVMLPYMMSRGDSTEQARKVAEELLDKVGLGKQIRKQANKLSGGQMQRVAIARSLINRPSIILADEPTGNLDTKSSDDVISLMKNLNRDFGHTFVVVTHDREIFGAVNRVITIRDGRVEGIEVVRRQLG